MIGAVYQMDVLAVIPTADGALLLCVLQRLKREATNEGLWLTSSITNAMNDRFRLVATEVGRVTPCAPSLVGNSYDPETPNGAHGVTRPTMPLPNTGTVSIDGENVRFIRPGLVEEYTVSMDGVRQDFIIEQRPV